MLTPEEQKVLFVMLSVVSLAVYYLLALGGSL